MYITLLQIDKFRNHKHSILELLKFNVIRGGNFQGKSGIAQAISMCFTPTTMGLDATGRGFATKIGRGERYAQLAADIQGKAHLVRRTVKLDTNTTGRTDSTICLDDPDWHPSPFEKQLDSNRAALAVCLNTDKFFTWDEKEQKSLLARLALPRQYDFPKDTIADVNKFLGEGTIDFDAEPFAVIEKAYKLLYKERETINRQVREFVIPESLPIPALENALIPEKWAIEPNYLESLQQSLVAAREKQKRLSKERDDAIFEANGNNVAAVKLQAKVDSLSEKIKEEREKLANLKGLLSEVKFNELTKIAEGKDELGRLEKEHQSVLTRITAKKAKVEAYSKIAGANGEECPTCHQQIDKDTIEALLEKAHVEMIAAQERDDQIVRQIHELGDVAGAVKVLEGHEKAIKEKAAIVASGQDKAKQLQTAKEELANIPKVNTETDVLIAFTKPLDEVDAEITTILEKLQPAMAAEERKKEITTKTEQLAKLKHKAYKVDLLVKYFDKDGIKSALLSEHVGGFVDKMNIVMAAFGYKVTLDIEPEFQFIVTDTTGVMTPVKELSGSEQLMFSVALQCAVSKAAGIGIVIADKLDTFLPDQRSKANKILYTLTQNGTLDQVICIMSDTSETVPKLPNSAFFMVEAGTVRRLV